MRNVWCVRAENGLYTQQFIAGGYMGIGWLRDQDLSSIHAREDLYPLYRVAHPNDTSNVVIGQQVGQIARFLLEIKAGDYIITPAASSERLHFGQVADDPSYVHVPNPNDGCPYTQRRRVLWSVNTLSRGVFSVPFQNSIRSSLTVFLVARQDEFLAAIGDPVPQRHSQGTYDPYNVVLQQILELDAAEFEVLVAHLLTALGFEGSEVTGRSGDGGVDAVGELNVFNLARVKVFVQAKRYDIGARIPASVVRNLRQAIPFGGQGAFITTASFPPAAHEVALEQGFPRIGLINGQQFVDLLVEHWSEIPEAFRDRLGLKPGLVLA
jgi:predicted Mrr-cat superfamily restriction endonuclease